MRRSRPPGGLSCQEREDRYCEGVRLILGSRIKVILSEENVKLTLEQVMKDQRESGDIALLFL